MFLYLYFSYNLYYVKYIFTVCHLNKMTYIHIESSLYIKTSFFIHLFLLFWRQNNGKLKNRLRIEAV